MVNFSNEFNKLISGEDPNSKAKLFVIFIVLMYVSVRSIFYIMSLFHYKNDNAVLIVPGMISDNNSKTISTNPNTEKGKRILRSKNQKGGLEFTYTFWLRTKSGYISTLTDIATFLIPDINYGTKIQSDLTSITLSHDPEVNCKDGNEYKLTNVFNKGNSGEKAIGGLYSIDCDPDHDQDNANPATNFYLVANKGNSPGVYLAKQSTSVVLAIIFDVVGNDTGSALTGENSHFNQIVIINNIPLDKWFHVGIVAIQDTAHIYINGILTKIQKFDNIIKQNYDDINIRDGDSDWGDISDLKYFNRALNKFELKSQTETPPNLTLMDGLLQNMFPSLHNSFYR
jgi:hypothetical protein